MRYSPLNIALAAVIVAIGGLGGFLLAAFSEADDAPGGVLIGGLIILGAIYFGLKTALKRQTGKLLAAGGDRLQTLEAELQATQAQLDQLQSQVVELEQKVSFTDTLLVSRNPERESR